MLGNWVHKYAGFVVLAVFVLNVGRKRHVALFVEDVEDGTLKGEFEELFLLGAAFAAELFLLVCMASRSASPRQVMYTFKDDVWDVIYRLNRRWNL